MASRFHCTAAVQRTAARSAHRVNEACTTVCKVLAQHPEHGLVVRGHAPLRKMRVRAPGLTTGKSGGYRLIYATTRVDESQHFVLVALYYKGDREDLDHAEYRAVRTQAAAILGNVIEHSWTTFSKP